MSTGDLHEAKIVVIGAGVVGSVTAYRLAQAGAEVTIVEKHYPGSGTSGHSFAWLNAFGKPPRAYHRLNARSIKDHQDLARELDGNWVHVNGGLQWAYVDDETTVERLAATSKQLREWGYRIETVSPGDVMRDIEPDLWIDPDRVSQVYYTPGEGWLDGVGLAHGAVATAMRRYGARLVRDEVVGFNPAGGKLDAVTLASGETLRADIVVNAAGPNAGVIASLAGADLPMRQQPGLLMSTEPAPVILKTVVHSPEGIVRSDGASRLRIHRGDFDERVESQYRLAPSDSFYQTAVDRLASVIPGLQGVKVENTWLGVRPMPKDGRPIVGFDSEINGLYHLVMHSGVTLSAAMGLLVVDDLLGHQPDELIPYRLERFDGQRLDYSVSDE